MEFGLYLRMYCIRGIATSWELCTKCEAEVFILKDRVSKCPNCGKRIIPCKSWRYKLKTYISFLLVIRFSSVNHKVKKTF